MFNYDLITPPLLKWVMFWLLGAYAIMFLIRYILKIKKIKKKLVVHHFFREIWLFIFTYYMCTKLFRKKRLVAWPM
jgi:hypothetical protein